MSALSPTHPPEAALQRVADGSLRGPEGLAVRAHCDACAECRAQLSTLTQLMQTLASLRDPPAPDDFLPGVMKAVEAREAQLAARRHVALAAIPAVAMGVFAALGWAVSAGLIPRLHELRSSLLLARTTFDVIGPVVEVIRLPLAAGALLSTLAILYALSRTLRAAPRAPIEV